MSNFCLIYYLKLNFEPKRSVSLTSACGTSLLLDVEISSAWSVNMKFLHCSNEIMYHKSCMEEVCFGIHNYIRTYHIEFEKCRRRPPLWSSDQSSWLQIQRTRV
jgi:hypothetical protein